MYKKFSFLLVISLIVLISSCSKETTPVSPIPDYTMYWSLAIGNTWDYETWDCDNLLVEDSLTAIEHQVSIFDLTLDGKAATAITSKLTDWFEGKETTSFDTNYVAWSNNILYEWFSIWGYMDNVGWLPMHNFESATSTILDTSFVNANDGSTTTYTGTEKITTKRIGFQNVTLKGKVYNALMIEGILATDGVYTEQGVGSYKTKSTWTIYNYYVKGIGLVLGKSTKDYNIDGKSFTSYSKVKLVDWNVK